MRLISVTRKNDGSKVFVNAEQVCAIYPYYGKEGVTVIQFAENNNYVLATESPNDIADMMQEGER